MKLLYKWWTKQNW